MFRENILINGPIHITQKICIALNRFKFDSDIVKWTCSVRKIPVVWKKGRKGEGSNWKHSKYLQLSELHVVYAWQLCQRPRYSAVLISKHTTIPSDDCSGQTTTDTLKFSLQAALWGHNSQLYMSDRIFSMGTKTFSNSLMAKAQE